MTNTPDIIVITSCTSRKKKVGPVLALKKLDSADSLASLARTWQSQVAAADVDTLQLASNLYGGRSMSEAKRAADLLDAPLYIVSAGHGLLRADEGIPAYDVTVTPAPNNDLHQHIMRLDCTPADWWQALIAAFGRQRSFVELMACAPGSIVLLAMPSVYLSMLADELAGLSDDQIGCLRVLTSPHGASILSPRLQRAVMPYDERLEGLPTFAGTRSDFPQRALCHFVAVLKGHTLSIEVARERVSHAMQGLRKPVIPERRRLSDGEITQLLRQNWQRFNGRATALLRFLRDEELVACEQSRFRALRQQLLAEGANRTGTYG